MKENYWEIIEKAVESVPAIKRTGLKAVELRERYAKLLMPLEGNINHVGMMYAGSLFALGEMTGGAIYCVSLDYTKFYPIVKEVHIKFIRPALTDVTTTVTMTPEEAKRLTRETLENGKADFDLKVELKDANDEVVTIVQGTYQLRPFN